MDGGNNKVTGKSGSQGNVCSFRVSDFSDTDNIRVLTENGTKGVGKVKACLFVNLYLIDSVDVLLSWVFQWY